MTLSVRNRKSETLCYIVMWSLVFAFYVLNDIRESIDLGRPVVNPFFLKNICKAFGPFMTLFVVNNFVLIPRFLLKNKYTQYFGATAILVVVVWFWQYLNFTAFIVNAHHVVPNHRPHRPLLPFPLFIDFTYDILTIGINISTALIFRQYHDKLERESLRNENAETQLTYLKAQINPHFYMNMLNNIHGMIDIDPAKAQDMVLDMSRLMRYMLYESSKPKVLLKDDVRFLNEYLKIMRMRYPESKVSINISFPDSETMKDIEVPPLIFLVFIENAFKHGISYSSKSYINISLAVNNDEIHFKCVNSVHGDAPNSNGIGLINAQRRLGLIYADRSSLEISHTNESHSVYLHIRP